MVYIFFNTAVRLKKPRGENIHTDKWNDYFPAVTQSYQYQIY